MKFQLVISSLSAGKINWPLATSLWRVISTYNSRNFDWRAVQLSIWLLMENSFIYFLSVWYLYFSFVHCKHHLYCSYPGQRKSRVLNSWWELNSHWLSIYCSQMRIRVHKSWQKSHSMSENSCQHPHENLNRLNSVTVAESWSELLGTRESFRLQEWEFELLATLIHPFSLGLPKRQCCELWSIV